MEFYANRFQTRGVMIDGLAAGKRRKRFWVHLEDLS